MRTLTSFGRFDPGTQGPSSLMRHIRAGCSAESGAAIVNHRAGRDSEAIGAAMIGKFTDWYVFGVYLHRANSQEGLLCAVNESAGTIAIIRNVRCGVPDSSARRDVLRSVPCCSRARRELLALGRQAEDPPPRAANGADCVDKTIRQYLGRCVKITDPGIGPRTADACVPEIDEDMFFPLRDCRVEQEATKAAS
jgi:hypothetical protein